MIRYTQKRFIMRARTAFALVGLALIVCSVIPTPFFSNASLPSVFAHSGHSLVYLLGIVLVLPFVWRVPSSPFRGAVPVFVLTTIVGLYLIACGIMLANFQIRPDIEFLPATVVTLSSLSAAFVLLLVMLVRFRDQLGKWIGFICLLCSAGTNLEMFTGWGITLLAVVVFLTQLAHYWHTVRCVPAITVNDTI